MTPTTFAYPSTDGRQLAAYRWDTDSERAPVGIVALFHGMGEHLRRYDHVAEALTAAGFVVYGHDHRGHGGSLAVDDQPGHLGADGWAALVEDLGLAVAKAKSDHPGLPVTVVAHSMGSFATQQFLLDHAAEVNAVALIGTAALDLLEPALDFTHDLEFSAFNAAFAPARTDFDWLSRDEAMVDQYLADPLCGFGIDAESTKAMFFAARRLADPAQFEGVPNDLPIYIAVGSKDPVNAELALVWPLVDRFRDAGLSDVTVRVYDDGRHEILNETNRAEVIDDLVRWLPRVSTAPSAHEPH